jgi:uncharacterized protein YeaO (DUF488 family)
LTLCPNGVIFQLEGSVKQAQSGTLGIRTKSIYSPPDPSDGIRILTTQYWPRGIPKAAVDEYVRKLGPSRELLHAFKRSEIDWPTYESGYLGEMQAEGPRQEIKRLARIALKQQLTILCVCKDEAFCHRRLLRDLIEKEACKLR